MKNDDELDDRIVHLFDQMRAVEPLDGVFAHEERAKFLNQGEIYRKTGFARTQQHKNGWIATLVPAFTRKERKLLLNFFIVMIVAVTALFGSGAAVVSAAQDSMPDEALYPVKTLSEDVRLLATKSYLQQLDLVLQYTDRRINEIATLVISQKPVPEGTVTRLEQQLNAALQIAANMETEPMLQALIRIRERVEVQAQTMTILNAGSQPAEAQLLRLEARLRQQSQLAAAGEADPQSFQLQMRYRQGQDANQPPSAGENSQNPGVTPLAPGNSYGPGPVFGDPTDSPGQFGVGPNGPNYTQTPTPGVNGYAPGPAYGATQTPYMVGPWWTLTPTITPKANHNGSGQGGSNSSGGSGGNGNK